MVRMPPVITYVTDPELTPSRQREVVERVVKASFGGYPARIAFRLPSWSDDEVTSLLAWYEDLLVGYRTQQGGLIRDTGPEHHLVHYRPGFSEHLEDAHHWLPAREIARASSLNGFVTYSVHSVAEAKLAEKHGATEVIVGHIFDSESHPREPGRGVALAIEIARAVHNHITVIGGITADNVGQVGQAGLTHFATMRAISRAPDIDAALWRLYQNWDQDLPKEKEL